MKEDIVVIYTFSLRDGATEKQFLDASGQLDDFLLHKDGFEYRTLTQLDTYEWQDIVYWQSEAHLKSADDMSELPAFQVLMGLLDADSVVRSVAKVHTSACPAMIAA